MNLRLPSITGATVGERLEQVVRYLFSLVNDLNFALGQREQEKLPQTAESESTEENNRLRPGSVTTDILADGAVTNDKIADGTIYKSKLSFSTDLIAGSGIAVEGRKISTAAAPYNLLDNSDFTNPVNQRGQTTYTSTYGGYTIDRWIANAALTLNVNTSTVTALSSGNTQNEFYQKIANPDRLLGKTVTFAIKTDIGTFVTNATIPSNFTDSWVTIGTAVNTDFGQIRFQISDNSTHVILAIVAVKSGAGVTIHWAALYEGAYTADTLPAYQPKGYAVERAECLRYREKVCVIGVISKGSYDGSVFRFGVNYSEKRVIPTISIVEFWSPGWYGQSDMGNVTVQVEDRFRAAICTDKAATAGLVAYCTVWVNADL